MNSVIFLMKFFWIQKSVEEWEQKLPKRNQVGFSNLSSGQAHNHWWAGGGAMPPKQRRRPPRTFSNAMRVVNFFHPPPKWVCSQTFCSDYSPVSELEENFWTCVGIYSYYSFFDSIRQYKMSNEKSWILFMKYSETDRHKIIASTYFMPPSADNIEISNLEVQNR